MGAIEWVLRRGRRRRNAGFLPTDIDGLVLWLRADMGVALNGSDVSSWIDQASGLDFVQAVEARQPVFVASTAALGGRPSVQFTASTEETLSAVSGAPLGALDDATLFVALEPITVPTGGRIIAAANSATIVYYSNVSGVYGVFDGSSHRSSATTPLAEAQVVDFAFDTAESEIRISRDNALVSGGALVYDDTCGLNAAVAIQIGNNPGLTIPLDARVAEICLYNRVLTASERALFHENAVARYGL